MHYADVFSSPFYQFQDCKIPIQVNCQRQTQTVPLRLSGCLIISSTFPPWLIAAKSMQQALTHLRNPTIHTNAITVFTISNVSSSSQECLDIPRKQRMASFNVITLEFLLTYLQANLEMFGVESIKDR